MTIQYNKDQTIYIRTGKDNPTLKLDLEKIYKAIPKESRPSSFNQWLIDELNMVKELKGLTLNQFLINKLKEIKQ